MVLHGAEDIAPRGEKLDGRGIEGFDPSSIDDRCRDPEFFEFGGGGEGEFAHVAEGDDRCAGAVAEDFRFADFQKAGLFCGDGPGACAARVADRRRPVVVGDCPEHIDEFLLVLRLHVDDARHWAEVGDVEESVVGWTVVAGEARAVHAESDIEVLESDVVDNHIVGPLHKGAVDGKKWLHAARSHAAREEGGVFLGDPDIVASVGMPFGEMDEAGAGWHGCGDGHDPVIRVREVGEVFAKELRVGRRVRWFGLAGVEVKFAKAVELVRLFKRGSVAFPLLREDVEDDGLVLCLEELEGFCKQGDIVAIHRAVVADAEVLEDDARGDEVLEGSLRLVGEFAGPLAGDPLHEAGGIFVEVGVGGIGGDAVQVVGHGAHVFGDRPFVVVEDDDEALGRVCHVVEGLKRDAAGEGGIARHAHDVFARSEFVPGHGHAEGGREGGARVACAVAVVLALGAEEESVQALILADCLQPAQATGEHFVNIALMADVEDKAVFGRLEDAVEGDGEFHDAEVRAEVSACVREDIDEFRADLIRKFRKILGGECLDVGGRLDRVEKGPGLVGHWAFATPRNRQTASG